MTRSTLQGLGIRAATAARTARDLTALRREDVWLATFPKTGSSWFRTILSHLAYDEPVPLAEIDRKVPALGAGTLGEPWTADLPRLIKTHHPYRPGLFARPARVLLLTRDPRDALASYHHMVSHRRVNRFEGTLANLVRHPALGVPAFLRHHASWSPRATTVVRYERLKADPVATLAAAFGDLGPPLEEARIAAAVEASSLARMRDREAADGIARQDRFDPAFSFVRSGGQRAEADRFSDADEAYYQILRADAGFDLYP